VSAPLVSVIVPAHDAGSTIVDTLESVCRQTVADLEVIVIDDGSTDDTSARVARVSDPRITLASFPGAGPSTARNRGMVRARGAYLSFLDADDLWTPDKLELQLEALGRRPDAGVAYSWTSEIDPAGRPLGPQPPVRHEGDVYAPMLLGYFLSSGSNALLRRAVIETVGEFDSGLRGVEDWDYFLRAAARWPFVVVPRYQILYRQSPGSASSRVAVMQEQSLRVVERAFASAPSHLQGLKPRTLANVHRSLARVALTREAGPDSVERARRSLVEALRLHPRLLLSPITLRLCVRWALARCISPRAVERIAAAWRRARYPHGV
jgi:glycosyltransferase involved in cell wall biosynthesis